MKRTLTAIAASAALTIGSAQENDMHQLPDMSGPDCVTYETIFEAPDLRGILTKTVCENTGTLLIAETYPSLDGGLSYLPEPEIFRYYDAQSTGDLLSTDKNWYEMNTPKGPVRAVPNAMIIAGTHIGPKIRDDGTRVFRTQNEFDAYVTSQFLLNRANIEYRGLRNLFSPEDRLDEAQR